MPKAVEKKLKAEGRKKGLKGDALDRFVFGTMNKLGLMKGSKTTAKGKRAEKKATVKKATMKKKK